MLIFQSSSIVILMFIWLRSCKIANHLRKKQNQASSTVETTEEHLPTYPCDKMHFLNKTWLWHGVQDAWYTDGCTPCSVLPTAQARKRSVFTTWNNLPQIFLARALPNLSLEKCFWWWPSTCRFMFFSNENSLATSFHFFYAVETGAFRTRHENGGTLARSSQHRKWQFIFRRFWIVEKSSCHLLIIRKFSSDPKCTRPRK